MEIKKHYNYKKSKRENSLSRAQQQTIDFVKELFSYKIVPDNQQIDFTWDDFISYSDRLANIFVFINFKKSYNKNEVKYVISETAKIEANNLMCNFISKGFKLPTKKWSKEEYIRYDVFVECCIRESIDYILSNYKFLDFSSTEIEHLKLYYFLSSMKVIKRIKEQHQMITLSVSKDFSENIKKILFNKIENIFKGLTISDNNKKYYKFSISKIIERNIQNGNIYL